MVTASIVLHKTPSFQIEKAINCLLNSFIEHIYIIDNSPTDILKNYIPDSPVLSYIHTLNKGFGAAHNIAIKLSFELRADFHLIMNPDVYWRGDILSPLIGYMQKNPNVGLIAPKVLNPDGSLQYSCRMLPTPGDLFIKRFFPSYLSKGRMKRYLLKDYSHDYPLDCPYLLGSFLLFRIEALKQCGIFDERFFMYPEDIDISRRLHESWNTVYWPLVSIFHEHQAASRKNLKMFGIHLINMIRYFNKWGWLDDPKRKKFNCKLVSQL